MTALTVLQCDGCGKLSEPFRFEASPEDWLRVERLHASVQYVSVALQDIVLCSDCWSDGTDSLVRIARRAVEHMRQTLEVQR